MRKKYKPSMFNRIIQNGTELVLYNSFSGTKGIVKVFESEKQDKIKDWLKRKVLEEIEDSDFKELIEAGYLVNSETDEKVLRKLRYMQHLSDNYLHMVIHTTKACNFRCSYCYMDFDSQMMEPGVQEGIIEYVRKNIQKFKAVKFSWFGGEPLLGMDAIENISHKVIEICRRQRKPYTAVVTTNGYNLTPPNIEKLLACHVSHIVVTIDGTKDLHNSQRMLSDGSGTFEHIIENLIYIRDKVKSRTLTVAIRTNITKKHIPLFDEYYSFFDGLFGCDNRFSLFVRPVADYGGQRVKELERCFIKDMQSVYRYFSVIQKDMRFHTNFIDLELGGYTCPARQMYKFTIGCDGKISKCDESLDENIGYLLPSGCMELNEERHAQWIFSEPQEECEDCFFSGSCFMEACPKSRICHGCNQCYVNFEEVDQLILWASKAYMVKKL